VARLIVAASVCQLGCPTPVQYGGPIPIDTAGLETRARLLCRARGNGAAELCAPAPTGEPSAGRVYLKYTRPKDGTPPPGEVVTR
jgi:hypothetical protein